MWVIAAIDRYGRIKSKFNTYEDEQSAFDDVDRAGDFFARDPRHAGWRAVPMTEYAYNQKLANQLENQRAD